MAFDGLKERVIQARALLVSLTALRMCVWHAHRDADTHTTRRAAFHEWNNRYTTIQWLSSGSTGGVVSRQEERYAMDEEVSGPANSRKMRWPFRVYPVLIFLFPFLRIRPSPTRSRAQTKSKVARDHEKAERISSILPRWTFLRGCSLG